MRLFLSSKAISASQGKAFMRLVGKDKPEDIKIALIENAADVYAKDKKDWVDENRYAISSHGFQVDPVDLKSYRQDSKGLRRRLEQSDAIWLGGGNTYYLRWILRETKADIIITELVRAGKVYGGGSAGAIVAGPTLKHFETADDPKKAPEKILDGLGLTDLVIVPHWNHEKYGPIVKDINDRFKQDGLRTQALTDMQALVIDGGSHKLI